MRELSVFCDESGDFGEVSSHSPYYLVSLIFHDQSKRIDSQIASFYRSLSDHGLAGLVPVHTAPLVRREERYADLEGRTRRKLFDVLFTFLLHCDIRHKAFVIDKRRHGCGHDLEVRLAKELGLFLRENLPYFQSFDRMVVYYDRGQAEITRLLRLVFSAALSGVELRTVSPGDYLLFQAADLSCTMELVDTKRRESGLSRSEEAFFGGAARFKRTYLKFYRRQDF